MNKEPLDDLNDLVTELKNSKALTGIMSPPKDDITTKSEAINEDNIDDFIYRKSSTLIQQGVDTIEAIKGTVLSGADADTIAAYSKLMGAVAASIEILNKINIQKRKEKAAKEIKKMDMEASSKLMDKYDGTSNIKTQNNIFVASREEILKALLGKAEDIAQAKNIIDVDVIETTPNNNP